MVFLWFWARPLVFLVILFFPVVFGYFHNFLKDFIDVLKRLRISLRNCGFPYGIQDSLKDFADFLKDFIDFLKESRISLRN